jgi:predicted nicotinamide N-methyase
VKTDPEVFILENTGVLSPPHVPEIKLRLATEAHDLWLRTEEELEEIGLPPPFWAFAWAGGQGLARHVLDHPELVAGRSLLDFASGSGLVGIAARMAGASAVLAADIDPWSGTAIRLNAALNGVVLDNTVEDMVGRDEGWDVVLAGDVFYDRGFADALVPWFSKLVARGAWRDGDRRRSRPRLLPARAHGSARDLRGAGDAGARRQRSQEDHRLALSSSSSDRVKRFSVWNRALKNSGG